MRPVLPTRQAALIGLSPASKRRGGHGGPWGTAGGAGFGKTPGKYKALKRTPSCDPDQLKK